MVTFFVTGDNHFGRHYDRYPEVKNVIIESRFECFQNMVRKADEENADFFVVTGDLFNSINNIKVSDVKRIIDILSEFDGRVLILPGNHDYYTGDEKVWKDFESILSTRDNSIILLNEFHPYSFEVRDEEIVVYPAYCGSKHSETNNLEWIKTVELKTDRVINVGIAHGALKGITPDIKEEYFLMTEEELKGVPIDVWFIGHTHIAYPADLDSQKETTGYSIFNAGTHEQTDLHNNTEGNGFIIRIEKIGEKSTIYARKYISGKIRYYDLSITVRPDSNHALKNALEKAVKDYSDDSIIRVTLSGTISQKEYDNKKDIYEEVLSRFLAFEKRDDELSEEITVEKIRSEFAETSFAAHFLEELTGNNVELQMAYQLLQECKER